MLYIKCMKDKKQFKVKYLWKHTEFIKQYLSKRFLVHVSSVKATISAITQSDVKSS